MINVRRSGERGFADHGWLQTHHTFSFAGYQDPRFMGYRSLRVINDDLVAPGGGFPTHPHRDMEILSYVVHGALEHRDSMGTGATVRAGDLQRMTAGTGIRHSEFNPSPTDSMRLLQIWILPGVRGLEPAYEQRHFPEEERRGRLRLVASPDGSDGSVTIHQDARVYATLLAPGERVEHQPAPGRGTWVQVVRGGAAVGPAELGEGDGAAIEGLPSLGLTGREAAELLVFDLA
jgi:redox-sensitive bicupin YhaK (pirin superfamily)